MRFMVLKMGEAVEMAGRKSDKEGNDPEKC